MKTQSKFAKLAALVIMGSLLLSIATLATAQSDQITNTTTVPRLIRFSGVARDLNGKPLTGTVGVTFALYAEQTGGAPLWMETQNVQADGSGHYSVLLGSTKPDGLAADIFASEQARWIGVQVEQQEEQPRALLVSAPYALKAGDAETLGGLPPSAFMLAAPQASGTATASAPVVSKAGSASSATATDVTTTGGKADYLPIFNGTSTIIDSVVYQSGTASTAKVGINTTTPSTTLDVNGAATVNGKLSATGVVSGSSYEIGSNLFAFGSYTKGSAFLGFAGNTTMTGAPNTAIGAGALRSDTTGTLNTATGYAALLGNTTGDENTATGYAALNDNTIGNNNTATGRSALFSNIQGNDNTAIGDAALLDNTASENTAIGYQALESNTTGTINTAIGSGSGGTLDNSNVTGVSNTLIGAGTSLSTGNLVLATAIGATAHVSCNTCLVLGAIPTNVGIGTPAPAATLHLDLLDHGASDTLLIGNTSSKGLEFFDSGAGVDIRSFGVPLFLNYAGQNTLLNYTGGKVGIGAVGETPSNLLTLQQGGGPAIADGWNTYSSRRWKTNIHPLQNALSKVEQLRGVSYDLKDSGKHEIGVIAEEVGQVVPEVVSYEKNGKDATGVDYSRLTALLIEAVKQQQKQIVAQQKAIALQQSQIRKQQRLVTTQQHEIAGLSRKVGFLESSLHSIHGETASVVASRVKTDSTTLLP
jgi:Chaperone of endosialidase